MTGPNRTSNEQDTPTFSPAVRMAMGALSLVFICATLFTSASNLIMVFGWLLAVLAFAPDLLRPNLVPTDSNRYVWSRNVILATGGLVTIGRGLYLVVGSPWATLAGIAVLAVVFCLVMYMVVTGGRRSGR